MSGRISSIVLAVLALFGVITLILEFTADNHDAMLYYSYVLIGLAILGTLGGGVIGMINNPSSIKGSIIGIVGLGAILGISWGLASPEMLESYPADVTEGQVRFSGMGLIALYITFIGAIGAILFSSVYSIIRK
jgi:hypothetical protein